MTAPISSARRVAGTALFVVSLVGFVAVIVNVVGHVFDLERLQLPGIGVIYVAISLGASFAATALLNPKQDEVGEQPEGD